MSEEQTAPHCPIPQSDSITKSPNLSSVRRFGYFPGCSRRRNNLSAGRTRRVDPHRPDRGDHLRRRQTDDAEEAYAVWQCWCRA
jgi:hypothetical protein